MANTTQDKLNLLQHSKDDIRNAINNKLESSQQFMPEDTPLSEYDTYIKQIKGSGTDTSDATATADDIIQGKTAYINGEKITGVIYTEDIHPLGPDTENNISLYNLGGVPTINFNGVSGGFRRRYLNTDTNIFVSVPQSNLANRLGLTADKLKKNETILGVTGTLEEGIDTSDATATANDIVLNKTAYVNGQKITGTLQVSQVMDQLPIWYVGANASTNGSFDMLLGRKAEFLIIYPRQKCERIDGFSNIVRTQPQVGDYVVMPYVCVENGTNVTYLIFGKLTNFTINNPFYEGKLIVLNGYIKSAFESAAGYN